MLGGLVGRQKQPDEQDGQANGGGEEEDGVPAEPKARRILADQPGQGSNQDGAWGNGRSDLLEERGRGPVLSRQREGE